MKTCSKCNLTKDLDLFYKKQSKCKECVKEQSRQYTLDNKEQISLNKKRYYLTNKNDILEYKKQYHLDNQDEKRAKCREYYYNNKDILKEKNRKYVKDHRLEINERVRMRKKVDILFKLSMSLRNRTRNFLSCKGLKKKLKFQEYIGCSLEELKLHLEKQFKPKMTWDNYMYNGWHIDHIIPLSSAKTEEEMYRLCHYTNLQPLWASDNFTKGGRHGI